MRGAFLLMSFLGVVMGIVQTVTSRSKGAGYFWGAITVAQMWLTLYWAGRLAS